MSEITMSESTGDVNDGRPEDGAGLMEPAGATGGSASAPSVPVRRRKPVLDQKLAQAGDFALAALRELAGPEEIGEGHRVTADDDRLVTHYFTSNRRGYRDWEWYVTIARAPRQGMPTVCESGLLPGEGALLAPHWVPWAERLSDDERDDEKDAEDDPGADQDAEPGTEPEQGPGPVSEDSEVDGAEAHGAGEIDEAEEADGADDETA